MKQEYIQSTEDYKGFTLELRMYCLTDKNRWHRKCYIYKDGEHIAISKNKKEGKEYVDYYYIRRVYNE
jgi:hypothetical protein